MMKHQQKIDWKLDFPLFKYSDQKYQCGADLNQCIDLPIVLIIECGVVY